VNPRVAALILLAVVAVVALTIWWMSRSAGIRRSDFKRMRDERDLAWKALQEIEQKADHYRDLDSVLATDIRAILRSHNTNRMELSR
jgi:hypothetical protein